MIKCLICKKEISKENSKYCSLKCRNVGITTRRKFKPCLWCGKTVEQTSGNGNKYCKNNLCRWEAIKHKRQDRNRKYCLHCEQMFYENPRNQKNRKYCSRTCAARAYHGIYTNKFLTPTHS